jgi:hypothetical protein
MRMSQTKFLVAGFLAIVVAACGEDPVVPRPLLPLDARQWVSSDLAGQLTSNGQFNLEQPRRPEGREIISKERAVLLAKSYIAQFGKYTLPQLERDHGAKVTLSELHPHDRVYYVDTPYASISDAVPVPQQRPFGPWYLVQMINPGDVPVISVAVSAYSTDVEVDEAGMLTFARDAGNEFLAVGIPADLAQEFPYSPERIAQIAFESTGRRVASVPELIHPGRPLLPQLARWRVTLDHPTHVQLRGNSSLRQVQEVYVGDSGKMYVPSSVQPSAVELTYMPNPLAIEGKSTAPERIDVLVRSGQVVAFEEVVHIDRD